MSYNKEIRNKLDEIAQEVVQKIGECSDPFQSPILVFQNTRISQWFKAYFLRKNQSVLMNVRFMTLSYFVNELLNPNKEYTIIGKVQMRQYIIKVLTEENGIQDLPQYIYENDVLNGNKLFEFASILSDLFMNYEYDGETISGWQKDVYEKAIEFAAKENCYTTKSLYKKRGITGSFVEPVYIVNNSYIGNLYDEILSDCSTTMITAYSLGENTSFKIQCEKVISAPSMAREMEAVHSEICKIIQDDAEVRFNDIVVYVPNISQYTSNIRQVFLQDDTEFLSIPFSIVGDKSEKQNMMASLKILADIANKGYVSRKDFYLFVKNAMIRKIHRIEEETIDIWMKTILDTKTHRNGEIEDDWKDLKRRLLLSVIVSEESRLENSVQIEGKEYLPYTSIDLTMENMSQMFEIIDWLMSWCELFEGQYATKVADSDFLQQMSQLLDVMYSIKGVDNEETNYFYREVCNEMEEIKCHFQTLPACTVMRLLQEAPNRFVSRPADMFVGGVTFLDLSIDHVVSSKYCFVMGLSSNQYPREDCISELDLSKNHRSYRDLDLATIRMICQNSNHVVFSYVNCDLQKDTPFYPSIVIPKEAEKISISLDETREYTELFTKRAFFSKRYMETVGEKKGASISQKESLEEPELIYEDVVKVKDIHGFLKNPFEYKMNKIFGKEFDDTEEKAEEFEWIDINKVEESMFPEKAYRIMRENGLLKNSIEDNKEKVKQKMQIDNLLPKGEVGNKAFEYLWKKFISEYNNIWLEGFSPVDSISILLEDPETHVKWMVVNDALLLRKEGESNPNELVYAHLKPSKFKYVLLLYAGMLTDIARLDSEEKKTITFWNAPKIAEEPFSITPKKAKEILIKLYREMNDFENIKYIDQKMVEYFLKHKQQIPGHIDSFVEALNADSKSEWKYLQNKKLFDAEKELGYTFEEINEFYCVFKKMIDMIEFLRQKEENADAKKV